MTTTDNIFKEALTLSPSEKAQLIDKLISTLDKSDKEIDKLWAKEAEDRIGEFPEAWHPCSKRTRRCQTRRFPWG